MKFTKKSKVQDEIPTASMPDIIFMLLIFFMVTTVLRQFTGLPVNIPDAEKIVKLESRRHISYVWIARDKRVMIDDQIVQVKDVSKIMYKKRIADPQIIVSLKIDQETEMEIVIAVQEELRIADATRINYATNFKTI